MLDLFVFLCVFTLAYDDFNPIYSFEPKDITTRSRMAHNRIDERRYISHDIQKLQLEFGIRNIQLESGTYSASLFDNITYFGEYWPTFRGILVLLIVDSINKPDHSCSSPALKYSMAFNENVGLVADVVSKRNGVDAHKLNACTRDADCTQNEKCGKRINQNQGT